VTTAAESQKAEQLFSLFLARNTEGKPQFSDDDILFFVPVLLQSCGDVAADHPAVQALMTLLGERLGARATDSAAELLKRLQDHYRQHPPPTALLQSFGRFFQEEAAAGTPSETAQAFSRFVGEARAHVPVSTSSPQGNSVFALRVKEAAPVSKKSKSRRNP